jgi:symplekin
MYASQMKDALLNQKERMDKAFLVEQAERRARREGRGGVLGKHPADAESSLDAIKRAKIEPEELLPVATLPPPPRIAATGREVDISPLPERFVIDAVMRGLQAISADALTQILEVSTLIHHNADVRRVEWPCNKTGLTRYHYSVKLYCLKAWWISKRRKPRMKMTRFSIPWTWTSKMTRIYW